MSKKSLINYDYDSDVLYIVAKKGMEEEFVGEPEHDGSTFKNSLHTIHRVAVYLNKNISDDDDIPEWVAEKMGAAKGITAAAPASAS